MRRQVVRELLVDVGHYFGPRGVRTPGITRRGVKK